MDHRLRFGFIPAFAAIYLIWGSTFLGNKFALTTIPPFCVAGTRCFLAGAILYGLGRWRGGAPPTLRQWAGSSLVGAALFVGGQGGVAWSQQRVSSGVACLVFATMPIWAVLIEAATEDRRALSPRRCLGIGAGLLGIVVLMEPRTLTEGPPVDVLGGCVLLGAAISWAVGSAVSRRLPLPSSLSVANGTCLLSGGTLLFLISFLTGDAVRFDRAGVALSSLVAVGYLVLFGSVVAFGAYGWLLRHTSLTAVSTYAFVNPVVAVFLGWALGGESLTQRVLFASGCVVSAILLVLYHDPGKG